MDGRDSRALVRALADRGVHTVVDGPASALARWIAWRTATGDPPAPGEIDESAWQIGCPLLLDSLNLSSRHPDVDTLADNLAAQADNGSSVVGLGGFGRGSSRVVAVVASPIALSLDPVARPPAGPIALSGSVPGSGEVEVAWLPGPERARAVVEGGRFHVDLPPNATAVDLLLRRGNLVIEAGHLDLVGSRPLTDAEVDDPEAAIRSGIDAIRAGKGLAALSGLPFAPCGEHPDALDGTALSREQICYTVPITTGPMEAWSVIARRPNAVWQLVDPRFDALGVVVGDGMLGFHLYERFAAADPDAVRAVLAPRLAQAERAPEAEAVVARELGAFDGAVIEVAAARVKDALLAGDGPFSPPADQWRVATLHAATIEDLPSGWPSDWPAPGRYALGYTTGRLASGENRHVVVVVVADSPGNPPTTSGIQ